MKLEAILAAQARLKRYIHQTPLLHSRSLSQLLNCKLYLKCENLQKIGAFKARGAMNFLLNHAELGASTTTFTTFSSGNHGQALAWSARTLGHKAVIFMPKNASPAKVAAVRSYGGTIEFVGLTSQERKEACEAFVDREKAVLVPPYDQESVVAGQGTTVLEIMEKLPLFDALLVPAGGGGLVSGCALAIDQLRPRTRVFPCEPERAADISQSLASGTLHAIANPDTIADGARNLSMGNLSWEILRRTVREGLTASEEQIVEAMILLATYCKLIVEPTGALGLACLLANPERFRGQTVVLILSGGNVDLSHYAALVAGHVSRA